MTGQDAIHGVQRSAAGAWQWVGGIPNRFRIAAKDRQEAREVADAIAAPPTIKDRQQQLAEFYVRYENLVETLCDAANYGPSPKLQNRYDLEREWMLKHYGPVRKFVVAYLQFDVADARMSGRSADAFEALYFAPDLEAFLRADDGNMIERIMRTREALNLYGEHLRQLLARERECA